MCCTALSDFMSLKSRGLSDNLGTKPTVCGVAWLLVLQQPKPQASTLHEGTTPVGLVPSLYFYFNIYSTKELGFFCSRKRNIYQNSENWSWWYIVSALLFHTLYYLCCTDCCHQCCCMPQWMYYVVLHPLRTLVYAFVLYVVSAAAAVAVIKPELFEHHSSWYTATQFSRPTEVSSPSSHSLSSLTSLEVSIIAQPWNLCLCQEFCFSTSWL